MTLMELEYCVTLLRSSNKCIMETIVSKLDNTEKEKLIAMALELKNTNTIYCITDKIF